MNPNQWFINITNQQSKQNTQKNTQHTHALIGHHKQIKTHKREENKDPYRRRKEAQRERKGEEMKREDLNGKKIICHELEKEELKINRGTEMILKFNYL